MSQTYNNEEIGISAEVAIAKAFDISISPEYKIRANEGIVRLLYQDIIDIFSNESIPKPKVHVAEKQNPVDFILTDEYTLSVKTNQKTLGKVVPQTIGQPTSRTYFEYFEDYLDFSVPLNYESKRQLFKEISINEIESVITHYWDHLFECDYLLAFFNIIDKNSFPNSRYKYIFLPKPRHTPNWSESKFKFTKNLENWGESCTVKYLSSEGKYVSIGEFQAHKNRDCLKFRFNLKRLLTLIDTNSI